MGDTRRYRGGQIREGIDYIRAGRQLQGARKRVDMTPRRLVELMGVVTSQLGLKPLPLELLARIERGKVPPHEEHIKYLESILELKQHELHTIFGYDVPKRKEYVEREPSPYDPNAETDRFDRNAMSPSRAKE